MSTPIVTVENLSKTYRTIERGESLGEVVRSFFAPRVLEVQALRGIGFELAEGELLGFLGPNGAGKSTTLKILTGVLHPTAGRAEVMGFTPWRERRRYVAHIGAVFGQKSQLIWDIPPIDSFHLNKEIYGLSKRDFDATLGELSDLLGVGEVMRRPTRQLSLGERMKCEFIMAMLHRPRIVFLDEPTIGLDVVAKDRIRAFILEMNKKGVTFILTTHDLGDVEHLAKRVIVINHGEIVFDDSMAGLKRHLGARRMVHLATEAPLPELDDTAGVTVTERVSPYEVLLELDVSALELNRFIKALQETCVIRDLSIQEPSIESIIKEIYRKGESAELTRDIIIHRIKGHKEHQEYQE